MKTLTLTAVLLIFCVKSLPVSGIVNGIDTPLGTEFRFNVLIYMRPPNVGSGAYIGGSYVLTVAQNIWPHSMESVSCGFGSIDRDQLIWLLTSDSYIHPNYNATSFDNNIAVLRIGSAVDTILKSNLVFPISMADNSIIQSDFTPGLIYGFGNTANDGDFATVLQQGFKRIQSEQTCIIDFPQLTNQFHNYFCARGGETNICYGDQGGAFVANGFLVGLSSYRWTDDCFNGKPSVYIRVSGYRDWIRTITGF